MNKQLVKLILDAVQSGDKSEIVNQIGSLPDRQIQRLLCRILITDSERGVRMEAVEWLGEIGTSADRKALVLMTYDDEMTVRTSAISSYATLPGKKSKKVFFRLMMDPGPIVRRYAVVGFADAMGPTDSVREAIDRFIAGESDPLALVGAYCALAGQFQDPDAMTKIQEFAKNPDPWLSSPAKQCLREIEERTDRAGSN